MVLEGATMFPPKSISQIEPWLLLKVVAPLWSSEQILRSIDNVQLGPRPELFHGQILRCYQNTLIYRYPLHRLLALHQNLYIYFFSTGTLRMRSVYLIILSSSILDVIYRCLNTPTVRSRITRITVGPSWSNILIYGQPILIRFWVDAASLELWMKSISASSPSSVLSPSSILYKWVVGSNTRVLYPVEDFC